MQKISKIKIPDNNQMNNIAKCQIKSKRQKNIAKKNSKKQSKAEEPVVVISSEEEYDEFPIQKRRQNSLVNNKHVIKFNNFDPNRLKKAVNVIEVPEDDHKLLLVDTIEKINDQQTQSKLQLSYQISGSSKIQHINHFQLSNRLTKFTVPTKKQEVKNRQEQQSIIIDKQNQTKNCTQLPQMHNLRYFHQIEEEEQKNRIIKCFRCGKKGHISKNCLEDMIREKCIICLGQHYYKECVQRICFKCCQEGHIAQDCRNNSIECRKCRRKGHRENDCGLIRMLDYHQTEGDKSMRQKYDLSDLKKLICLNLCREPKGHFNCFRYSNRHDQPYHTKSSDQQSRNRSKSKKNRKKWEDLDLY